MGLFSSESPKDFENLRKHLSLIEGQVGRLSDLVNALSDKTTAVLNRTAEGFANLDMEMKRQTDTLTANMMTVHDRPTNLDTVDKMTNMAANQRPAKPIHYSEKPDRYFVRLANGTKIGFKTKHSLANTYGLAQSTITRHMHDNIINKGVIDLVIEQRDNYKRNGNNTVYHVMRGNQVYKDFPTTRDVLNTYHVSNYTLYKYLNDDYQIQEADLLAHPVQPRKAKTEPVFNLTK